MSNPSLLQQLLARDPRKLVRFPDTPVDAAMAELRDLQRHFEAAQVLASTPPPAAPTVTPPAPGAAAATWPEGFAGSLADVATQVWRAKTKLTDSGTGEPREESRKVYRHIESASDALARMGVAMNDWLNQPFDPGLPVKVLTFQPTPGLERDTVVEAVRPTVIWKDQLLQLGEVVVGIPANTDHPS